MLVAAAFLAGCATTPPESEEVIESLPAVPDNEAASLNWTAPGGVQPFPAARTYQLPGRRPRTTAPVTMWTSLNRWAAQNNIGGPQLLSHVPVSSYTVKSPNGTMVVDIGSREATWNGVEVHLGFAPQYIDDQIFVRGLDLQKNFEPLLFGAPLTFDNRVIVIDPGHGGANVGTRSAVDGRLEKEFTLDWALRLAPLLAANGWRVLLTRTNDVDIALSNRVDFAIAHHADAFVSLHFNSTPDRDRNVAGLETYCSAPMGMPSNVTRDFPDIVSQFFPNNNYDVQNLQLAVRLQGALTRATGEDDRGVRRVRYIGVLHRQQCPAVLLEGGYLSSPREARQIANPEFRQKLAEAVADALK
jgi:N-acetylmuramoyl-L-alanine amidase